MIVNRPKYHTPVICIDDFLSEAEASAVLQECIDLKKLLMPARVFDSLGKVTVDAAYRQNQVVYLDQIFESAPDRSDTLRILKQKIWEPDCRSLWHEGNYIFDLINYSTRQEAIISHYGNGQYYHRHQDTRRDKITSRIVTLIYYVNKTPKLFSGGELLISDADELLKIEPMHNRAIVFPSFSYHSVDTVHLQSADWSDGRFSVNYWIGF